MCSLNKNNEMESNIYYFKPFKVTKVPRYDNREILMPENFYNIAADSSNLYFLDICKLDAESETGFLDLWRLNFATRKLYHFRELPEMNIDTFVIHRNLLMTYGGRCQSDCSNKLHVCCVNEESGRIASISTTGDLPLPLIAQAVTCHDNYLYTIGGTSIPPDIKNLNIHRLNLKTFVWEIVYLCNGKSKREPKGRYGHDIAFDGATFYILGGYLRYEPCGFSSMLTFNLKTLEWNKQESIGDPIWGFPLADDRLGAVQVDAETRIHIYIMCKNDSNHDFSNLWKLDLDNFQWTKLVVCRLPRLLHFNGVTATSEGKLYVYGEVSEGDLSYERDTAIFATWSCIPKLSEVCWEALLAYHPHLVKCKSKELVSLGIPARFVSRISNI